MKVAIDAIAYSLPAAVVTNADLQKENPSWDMARVALKSGVLKRHIAREDETALDLALRACRKLPKKELAKVDGIIFCTQSPDYVMPSNAFLLHKHLGLPDSVLAFDINLACSGYVYGLALARSLIVSKTASRILLVTGDTYSRYINKKDRSARVLFGDGAAASLIAASRSSAGIEDLILASSGKGYDRFMIPAGGCRLPRSRRTALRRTDASGNVRTQDDIYMDGLGVWNFVQSKVPLQIKELLKRNRLGVSDIDLFVFHQASRMTLDSLVKALGAPPERVFSNLSRVGNTVSASIPIALRDALDAKRIERGDRVLLSGFGVGLSWASALVRF